MKEKLSMFEKQAISFMEKRLKIENEIKADLKKEIDNIYKKILILLSTIGPISISNITSIIENDINPIINEHKNRQIDILDNAILNGYDVGINNGYRMLQVLEPGISPIMKEEKESQDILLGLLIYSRTLIESLNSDLRNKIENDITGLYINSKRRSGSINRVERNTENNYTINTVLSGAIIGEYINSNYNNITNRSAVIGQTETNRSLNHGQLFAFMVGLRTISNLKVRWIEIRDNKVCEHCRKAATGGINRQGIYHINSVSPPPLHPNCRCILVPWI